MLKYQRSVELSRGIHVYGQFLPLPLVARLNGQGSIIFLERKGTEKTFNISFEEIDQLATRKQEILRQEQEV